MFLCVVSVEGLGAQSLGVLYTATRKESTFVCSRHHHRTGFTFQEDKRIEVNSCPRVSVELSARFASGQNTCITCVGFGMTLWNCSKESKSILEYPETGTMRGYMVRCVEADCRISSIWISR